MGHTTWYKTSCKWESSSQKLLQESGPKCLIHARHIIFGEAQITKTKILGFFTAQATLSFLQESLHPFEQCQSAGEVSYCFTMQKPDASSETRNNSHTSEDVISK